MGPHPGSGIWLDYSKAGRKDGFLPNLSAVAAAGDYLWTASDEMRTIECLRRHRGGYHLHQQYGLDQLFPGLPRAADGHEADIEALDVAGRYLWVCGSHSLTRRSQRKTNTDRVDARIHKRPSRILLGAVQLLGDGGGVRGPGRSLPFRRTGSLRAVNFIRQRKLINAVAIVPPGEAIGHHSHAIGQAPDLDRARFVP